MPRFGSLPISARLALWYALTLLLLLSAFAAFSYAGFHAAAQRSFDRHLEHELGAVRPLVRVGPDGALDASALDREASVATRLDGPNATYVRVLAPGGAVVYASRNFAGAPPLGIDRSGERTFERQWNGGPVRSLVVPIDRLGDGPGGGVAGYIEVTGYQWSRDRELGELGQTLAAGVLASALLALALGWWLARRALRPVAVMTEAAGRMAAGGADLGRRLPSDFDTRDELTALAETFNRLLGRLEASVERERRFTANAAHELLTPIATLRSEAEVALRREREPSVYREALGRVVYDAADMASTVEGLLRLARAEATPPAGGRLDLGALVRQRAGRARAAADARGVAITVDAADAVCVAADAAPMAEVVDNLVSNAVKYTPPGGRVEVRVVRLGARAHVEVADTGAGFDAPTAERLFDRFFRADTPEVQAEPGSGLGLAIVRAIAEEYGGTVSGTSAGAGRGAAFRVDLPLHPCEP